MPSTKPELRTRVAGEIKAAFLGHAKEQNLSEARLLEILIATFLQNNPPRSGPVDSLDSGKSGEAKSRDVRVRLSLFEYEALEQLARERHWQRSTYLRYLFQVHLTGQPRFSDDEMLALREATGELSALGRNVNQIARALNPSLVDVHLALAVPFAELKTVIDQQRSSVKNVIRANLKSWGVADGE